MTSLAHTVASLPCTVSKPFLTNSLPLHRGPAQHLHDEAARPRSTSSLWCFTKCLQLNGTAFRLHFEICLIMKATLYWNFTRFVMTTFKFWWQCKISIWKLRFLLNEGGSLRLPIDATYNQISSLQNSSIKFSHQLANLVMSILACKFITNHFWK